MADTQLGQALLDVPMAEIIERMGRSIATAQRRLDAVSIETAVELGESTLELNEGGAVVIRSLLELGFLPTFYQFTDTTIDISVALTIRTGEDVHFVLTGSVGRAGGTGGTGASPLSPTGAAPSGPTGPRGPTGPSGPTSSSGVLGTQVIGAATSAIGSTIFGVTLSAEYTRRYQFDSTASSKVSTKMVAVPAPPAFLEALKINFGIGARP
jgi:hypothetical protein